MPRAGLGPASVTRAGAVLADETGLDHLSMGLLAERLGVRTPSLYKHVDNIADLTHRIGVLAMVELAEATGDAIQGRAGSDALVAAAQAIRRFVHEHPGRYAAGNAARCTGPGDPLVPAARRVVDSLSAALRGYGLDPAEQVHALRMLRSLVHGFASLEERLGLVLEETSTDESFHWMIALVDEGLRAGGRIDGPREQSRGTT
ncbi:TetR-like C-terminal domain-containing protein [Nocardioides sp. 503]|uniref:TetR/AcrR family transcriptional regulator n=1 Tax=Nocardioides sp. 503 TaxID=2508326 RepID=UPI00106FFC6B|nr:TetR-like C-terminal domain-containing protein [Nocardioides sp. 503]